MKSFFESVGIIENHDKTCDFYVKPYLEFKEVMRGNYHVHTKYCGHATGEIDEYVERAIARGLTHLGISCHVPLDDEHVFYGTHQTRMKRSDFRQYNEEIDQAIVKYASDIVIYKAFECDNFADYFEEYQTYFDEHKFDYFLLSNHFDRKTGLPFSKEQSLSVEEYLELFIPALKTGMFSIIAHPDAFLRASDELTPTIKSTIKELCDTCIEHDVCLELNVSRVQRNHSLQRELVWLEFWKEVSSHGTKVIISDDAHKPENLETEFTEFTYQLANELKLNIVERIKLKAN